MHGKEKKFLDVSEGIDAFKDKIELWLHRVKSGRALNLFV